MAEFYTDTLRTLLRRKVIRPDMRVLVVCGGTSDRDALRDCGFRRVVISNVDRRLNASLMEPYQWSYQDAENLQYADDEFDACIAHSGLHHCQSPHRAMLEMYRVARAAVIGFEPLDNVTTRVGVKLGFGEEYEVASVAGQACELGGVRNTEIPNHIYRWTNREIEKTIKSYAPTADHDFHYFYRTRINRARLRSLKNPLIRSAFSIAAPLASLISRITPRESNNFAFCVVKPQIPEQLLPWLTQEEGQLALNRQWIADRYECPTEADLGVGS